MRVSILRFVVGWAMIWVVPVTLLGQSPAAILHSQGGVWVNGYEARDSSAIFSGDALETKPGFSATLTLEGSSVLLAPETIGKFEGDVFVLDHGSVAVETSTGFRVRVKCITVTPVVKDFTKYEVSDVNRIVQVAARKLDVNVEGEAKQKKTVQEPDTQNSQGGVVHETEQKNYDENQICGAPPELVTSGSSLNPKWIAAGAGGAGLLLCLIVCIGHGGNKQTVSPSSP